jgi:hypothetical protein
MPHRKMRHASSVSAPESSDDEVDHNTDDEMSLIPGGTEKKAAFLVTNWLVGEGEG